MTGPDGGHDIWMVVVETGEEIAIAEDGVDKYWPFWSPDGSRLAYHRVVAQPNLPRLVVVDVDGGTIGDGVELGSDPLIGGAPLVWSPDGTRLVGFPGDDEAQSSLRIELFDASGTGPPIVIPAPSTWASASWQRLAP